MTTMASCRPGDLDERKREVIRAVLKLTMFSLACALLIFKGATSGGALLSNFAKLSEIRLRFEGGAELKSTPADAKRIWERVAAAKGVDQPEHWRAVGEIALLDQEWGKAVLAFEQGIVLSADPYNLYLALARAHLVMGNSDGAMSNYEAVVQLDPKRSVDVYLLAADIELQRGNYPGFAAWCERARQSFPNSHVPDRTQGIAAWQLGKWEEAERLLQNAHQKSPGDPYPLYYLALTKSAQGDFLAAARYMERAIVTFREMPGSFPLPCDWFVIAGDLYQQANDLKAAKSMYQQGLVHCPQEQIFTNRLRAIQAVP